MCTKIKGYYNYNYNSTVDSRFSTVQLCTIACVFYQSEKNDKSFIFLPIFPYCNHGTNLLPILLLPSCGTGYIVVVVTYITHVLRVCSSIHDSAAITCTFAIFFTVQQQQCAIIQVNHIQRVMPSGMEEGAPAVLGTVAF